MKVIGLTGGIASGKSTVASILASSGAIVLDADSIAREVVQPGKPAWVGILQRFGEDILFVDGEVNRKKLADVIFNDSLQRKALNSIVHPRVIDEILSRIGVIRRSGITTVVILDVPLLFESGMDEQVDYVLLVKADLDTQVKRIMKRDSLSEEQALSRIRAQMPLKEKLKRADFVIEGELPMKVLRQQLGLLWNNLHS